MTIGNGSRTIEVGLAALHATAKESRVGGCGSIQNSGSVSRGLSGSVHTFHIEASNITVRADTREGEATNQWLASVVHAPVSVVCIAIQRLIYTTTVG